MISECFQYFILRNTNGNTRSSFSGQIKSRIKFIYIHGVKNLQKGGLKIIRQAIQLLHKNYQQAVDEIIIVDTNFMLDLRIKKIKAFSFMSSTIGMHQPLCMELFRCVKHVNSIFDLLKMKVLDTLSAIKQQKSKIHFEDFVILFSRILNLLPPSLMEKLLKDIEQRMTSLYKKAKPKMESDLAQS